MASTMLAGHRSSFAIEAELLEIHNKWTFGRVRFWVAGAPIGKFDETSDLATSARWGRTFLEASLRRTRAELDVMTTTDVYELLYGQFVMDLRRPIEVQSPKAPSTSIWDRDPYLLDDVGESALRDKYAVLAVRRGDGQDRLIVNAFRGELLSESLLPAGACDATVASYCAWVEQLRAA